MSVLQRNLPLHDQKVILQNFDPDWDDMKKKVRCDLELYDITIKK